MFGLCRRGDLTLSHETSVWLSCSEDIRSTQVFGYAYFSLGDVTNVNAICCSVYAVRSAADSPERTGIMASGGLA